MWPPGEADKRGSRTGPASVRWMPHPLLRARARRWLRQSSCLPTTWQSQWCDLHPPMYLGTPIRNGGPDDRHARTLRWRQQHEPGWSPRCSRSPSSQGRRLLRSALPRQRTRSLAGRRTLRRWRPTPRSSSSVELDAGARRWCSMASAIPSCGAQLERCPTQRRRAMASTYRKGRWTSSPPRVRSTWPQCTPGSAPHRAQPSLSYPALTSLSLPAPARPVRCCAPASTP